MQFNQQCLPVSLLGTILYTYINVFMVVNNYKAIGDEYFLVATRFTIARVSLDGSLHQVLADNLTNAVAIDYNYR